MSVGDCHRSVGRIRLCLVTGSGQSSAARWEWSMDHVHHVALAANVLQHVEVVAIRRICSWSEGDLPDKVIELVGLPLGGPHGDPGAHRLTGGVIAIIGICAATGGFWNIWCCVGGWL